MTSELHDADLVLEGGGVKGIGLVGAYTTLVERGYQIRRVAGTSAGAIVGALIAAGMSPDLMEKTMKEIKYPDFADPGLLERLGVAGMAASLIFDKGIYEGDYLRDWLDDRLSELGHATFGDLKITDPEGALPPEKSYRLVVLTADVTCGRLVHLPWDYPLYGRNPDEERVADAVRASMSIPFYYEPVRFEYDTPKGQTSSYLVDGGMLSNFPVGIFDRTDAPPRWPTLGVKLSARVTSPTEKRYNVHGPVSLLLAMGRTLMRFHDQMHIEDPAVRARSMFVDTNDVQATDFDIDEAAQTALFDNGKAAAARFLDGDAQQPAWNFEDYVAKYRTPPPTT